MKEHHDCVVRHSKQLNRDAKELRVITPRHHITAPMDRADEWLFFVLAVVDIERECESSDASKEKYEVQYK